MAEGRRPFSNGSERYGWEEHNCGKCWKNTPPERGFNFRCAIQGAVIKACDLDQPVPPTIAERVGWKPDDLFFPDCPEREAHRPNAIVKRGPRVGSEQGALDV